MLKALTELKALKQYTDDGYANRNWNDTTNLVITNKAGLQIMGDWARGEFSAAGMTGVKDFGCMIGLNEDNPIVSTDGDVIVFPKQSDPGRGSRPEASCGAPDQPGGPGRVQQRQGLHAGARRRRHGDRRSLHAEGAEGGRGSGPRSRAASSGSSRKTRRTS